MSDLQLLFDNKIDHIVVEDFLNAKQISSLLAAITQQPEWKEAEIPETHEHLFADKKKPMHLFSSQYMLVAKGFNENQYLELCKNYYTVWKKVIATCKFDPFLNLIKYLKNTYQIEVQPAAKNHSTYFPLVARDLSEEVLPHADYGPYDAPDWVIDQVTKQIAWNIYLTDPGKGGETIVYDRVWHDSDVLDESSYGIQNFKAPIKIKFFVKPGRLVLFNSRNFHAVLKAAVPRIAIGGLMGQTKNGKYIAWG